MANLTQTIGHYELEFLELNIMYKNVWVKAGKSSDKVEPQ